MVWEVQEPFKRQVSNFPREGSPLSPMLHRQSTGRDSHLARNKRIVANHQYPGHTTPKTLCTDSHNERTGDQCQKLTQEKGSMIDFKS